MNVFIARGDHYSVPGHLLRVHGTIEAARVSALEFLNVIRHDIGMKSVKRFTRASVAATQAKVRSQLDDDNECDVWIETHKVLP